MEEGHGGDGGIVGRGRYRFEFRLVDGELALDEVCFQGFMR